MKRGLVPMTSVPGAPMVRMSAQNQMAVIGHLFVGAQREWKGFEKALMRVGVLPANMAAIPGDGAPLDQYGNIPRGFMIQLLAYFSAFRESGSLQNMTDKTRGRFERRLSKKAAGALQFFAVKDNKSGRGLHPGIWQRVNYSHGTSAVKPIIIFGKGRPTYRKFIDIAAIGDAAYRDTFDAEYDAAFAEALRTAW
ncbi:MAG: hypothetical protein NTX56_09380 [Proteobacteria bacterium]|nr:hypothetical protein [Pseudomonadota bacterium]